MFTELDMLKVADLSNQKPIDYLHFQILFLGPYNYKFWLIFPTVNMTGTDIWHLQTENGNLLSCHSKLSSKHQRGETILDL